MHLALGNQDGGMGLSYQVLNGDALTMLKALPSESVNCIVTSPPYYGLRDYGHDGQIGLEQTPQEFIGKLVDVFHECRRVLTKDGTCWVNMGDSYASGGRTYRDADEKLQSRGMSVRPKDAQGIKPKDLLGIPWRLAFALQDDGWYLRQDIIWAKPNPMPESVRDRCTKAHEYIFMLTKSPKYWYDAQAISESASPLSNMTGGPMSGFNVKHCPNNAQPSKKQDALGKSTYTGFNERYASSGGVQTRNARSVWVVAPEPYPGAHFAVFPAEIPKRCILAGCPENGVVLDPFAGSGTTLAVAVSLGRQAIGLELNPEYVALIRERMSGVIPSLFAEATNGS